MFFDHDNDTRLDVAIAIAIAIAIANVNETGMANARRVRAGPSTHGGICSCVTPVRGGMVVRSEPPSDIAPFGATTAAEDRTPDILVVGAGPAGLAAATAAAEAGANVTLLDERTATGGQYNKPLGGALRDAAPDAAHAVRSS